jgi:uncharacterized Zn finger protein
MKCRHSYHPYGKTRFVVKSYRQGMSSVPMSKVVKQVRVRCEECGRVTWQDAMTEKEYARHDM